MKRPKKVSELHSKSEVKGQNTIENGTSSVQRQTKSSLELPFITFKVYHIILLLAEVDINYSFILAQISIRGKKTQMELQGNFNTFFKLYGSYFFPPQIFSSSWKIIILHFILTKNIITNSCQVG